jgi:hypothetical protein
MGRVNPERGCCVKCRRRATTESALRCRLLTVGGSQRRLWPSTYHHTTPEGWGPFFF